MAASCPCDDGKPDSDFHDLVFIIELVNQAARVKNRLSRIKHPILKKLSAKSIRQIIETHSG